MSLDVCVFCRIISGEIPATKVFEGDGLWAIKDIKPISEGHAVVFSVNHYTSSAQMPPEELGKLFKKTVELAEIIKKDVGAEGYNLLVCEGEAAQSTVPHRPHIHIIPRKNLDGVHIDPRT
jgi:histidine triad (HIT) family protein